MASAIFEDASVENVRWEGAGACWPEAISAAARFPLATVVGGAGCASWGLASAAATGASLRAGSTAGTMADVVAAAIVCGVETAAMEELGATAAACGLTSATWCWGPASIRSTVPSATNVPAKIPRAIPSPAYTVVRNSAPRVGPEPGSGL
jgi:hypothetical protein